MEEVGFYPAEKKHIMIMIEKGYAPAEIMTRIREIGFDYESAKKLYRQANTDLRENKPEAKMENNEDNKYRNLAALLNDDLVTVKCYFTPGGKCYSYKCTKAVAQTLNPNDWVVCESSENDLRLCQVASVDDTLDINPESNIDYKYVIQRVDIESLLKLRDQDSEIVEKIKLSRRAAVRRQFIESLGIDIAQLRLGK